MHASFSAPVHSRIVNRLKAAPQSRLRFSVLILAVVTASTALAAEPSLRILKGNNQETVYASAFAVSLTVQVVDSVTKQPIAGVQVVFSAAQGTGLNASSEITNSDGIAAVSAIGTAAGASAVSAQIAGQPASLVQFSNLAVNKAVLTVVPSDINVTVGAGLPAITEYAIRGFVNGDTEATAQISGAPILTTTAKGNSPRENYAIKGGVGTLNSPNYNFVAGFGTLAVIGAPEALTEIAPAQQFGIARDLTKEPVEIRPALAAQPVAVPAFLAGLRGESGVFVQKAIWQAQAAHPATSPSEVHNAMVPKVATAAPLAAVPVRPAVAPKPVVSSVPPASAVRSVAFAHPTPAQTVLSSSSVSAIRKAFNPPGTK
jgi:hypothetical protein